MTKAVLVFVSSICLQGCFGISKAPLTDESRYNVQNITEYETKIYFIKEGQEQYTVSVSVTSGDYAEVETATTIFAELHERYENAPIRPENVFDGFCVEFYEQDLFLGSSLNINYEISDFVSTVNEAGLNIHTYTIVIDEYTESKSTFCQ